MKKMDRPQKVFRGLLICAMGLVLTGVTLTQVYATYQIKVDVEHIFKDSSNGTTLDKDTYGEQTPRDDLIDDLGSDGIQVIVEGKVDEVDQKFEDFKATGNATGMDIGMKEALELAETLVGKEGLTDEELAEIRDSYKEANDLKWMDDIPAKPEGEAPPKPSTVVRDEPALEVEGLEDVLPQWTDAAMSKEDYQKACQDALQKYVDGLGEDVEIDLKDLQDKVNAALDEYAKDVQGYFKEQADREKEEQELAAWIEANGEEAYAAWGTWDQYVDANSKYFGAMESVWGQLRELITASGEAFETTQVFDKDLQVGYVKAYEKVFSAIAAAIQEDGSFDTDMAKSALEALRGEFSPLDRVEVDTWQTPADGMENEDTPYDVNPFEFVATLDAEDAKILEENDYTSTLSKITVVCISKGEESRTYISTDGGKTWREDGAGEPQTSDQIMESLGEGFIAKAAVTFTFEHKWTPSYEGPAGPAFEGVEVKVETEAPETTPEPTPTPEEELEEPEVPLADAEEEEPEVPVEGPEIPLSDIPQTGDVSFVWYCMALASAAGLLVLALQDRRSRKEA